jgi:hypothetical protein
MPATRQQRGAAKADRAGTNDSNFHGEILSLGSILEGMDSVLNSVGVYRLCAAPRPAHTLA